MAEHKTHHLHLAWQGLSEMIAQKTAEPVFPVKAVAGCLCIFAVILYLPLGVLLFGGFLYLHLILRMSATPILASDSGAQQMIFSPIDGQILTIGNDRYGQFIVFTPQVFDSHVIYAPVEGELAQHIHFSGRFDMVQVSAEEITIPEHNMRHEYVIEFGTESLKLDIVGTRFNRIVSAFIDEGKKLARREAIASAIFHPIIIMHLPDSYQLECHLSQRCIAGDTPIAQKT